MEFKKINISDLKHAKYNPRKDLKPGDKEFEKIKNSINEFGYCDPIILNNDLTIIGGHQRAKVLKELGFTEVDCVIINIDKTKEKALNVALNKKDHYLHSVAIGAMLIPYNAWYGGEHEPQPKK